MKHIPVMILGFVTAWAQAAAADGEINIYSYRQPGLILPMLEAFTEETGIDVNISFLDSGLVKRLQLEGDRTPADLILTVDISRLHAAVEGGVTQPVASDIITGAIPANYRDPGGEWFALTLRARVVYASRDRVPGGALTHYEQLADADWRDRICTRSGTHAYNLSLIAAHVAHHGEMQTRAWLEGLKANLARKPQGNDRAQVKAIWAGECDISVGNTYYMGKMLENSEQQEWANSVRILFPEFRNAGTHMNVSGMALVRHAPHRADAIRLMEFLVSSTAQELYAEDNYEYPVRRDVAASDLVSSWGALTHDSLSLSEIAELRPVALRLVEEVDFDG
ncbi:MAG: Fe(3+) ABC transporter substrate-binding protein [Rhodobacteraceae bacterium]|nr:Fe(3+) ABC transporter substrate-binding protein [Paracoccaceae bacterium]